MNTRSFRPHCRLSWAAALALAVFAAAPAHAGVMAAGDTIALSGTTSAAQPFLAGTVLEDEVLNFSLPAAPNSTQLITGTVQQRVVREDGSGTLDFYWRITELAGGSLGYFRLGNFHTSVYDAEFRQDGVGDVGPNSAHRFTGAFDSDVNFIFADDVGNDTLSAGQSSKYMFLHTSATQYDKSALFDIASHGTFTESSLFAAFAPSQVPEPTGLALVLGALAALSLSRRRQPAD